MLSTKCCTRIPQAYSQPVQSHGPKLNGLLGTLTVCAESLPTPAERPATLSVSTLFGLECLSRPSCESSPSAPSPQQSEPSRSSATENGRILMPVSRPPARASFPSTSLLHSNHTSYSMPLPMLASHFKDLRNCSTSAAAIAPDIHSGYP